MRLFRVQVVWSVGLLPLGVLPRLWLGVDDPAARDPGYGARNGGLTMARKQEAQRHPALRLAEGLRMLRYKLGECTRQQAITESPY